MFAYKYVDENGLAAMLAVKSTAGAIPKANLREYTSCAALPSADKAAHSGFETQMKHLQKSKIQASVAPPEGHVSTKSYLKDEQKT